MNLDNLKSDWKSTGSSRKNKEQLLKMTKIKNHPKIKRMRLKFLIEGIMVLAFIAVYYNAFDGGAKPFWANMLLVGCSIAYTLNRFIGWLVLRNPIKENNLKTSLLRFQGQLKSIAISILLTTFIFGFTLILFFTATVELTTLKSVVLAGMILSLILMVYLSGRIWMKRIKNINKTILELS